jgi:hypothetical protein
MLALLTGLPVVGQLITFAIGPVGRYVVLAAAAFIWLQIHDAKIESRVRAECKSAALQATIDDLRDRLRINQNIITAAEQRQDEAERRLTAMEKERDQALVELGEEGKSSCVIPKRTLDRMRNIR